MKAFLTCAALFAVPAVTEAQSLPHRTEQLQNEAIKLLGERVNDHDKAILKMMREAQQLKSQPYQQPQAPAYQSIPTPAYRPTTYQPNDSVSRNNAIADALAEVLWTMAQKGQIPNLPTAPPPYHAPASQPPPQAAPQSPTLPTFVLPANTTATVAANIGSRQPAATPTTWTQSTQVEMSLGRKRK